MTPCLLSLLVAAGLLVGCNKDKADDSSKTPAALNADSVKQSLEALKPKLSALNKKFAALHEQFDPLPPNLPGFGEVRAKFYDTDVGMGIMGPKLTWLSERLDSALKSGNREELQKVSQDIAKTHEELARIDRTAIEVQQQVVPFRRMLEEKAQETASGSAFVRVLATGRELKANPGGIEQRLLEFIDDPSSKVDENSWFDFDRIHFAEGGAELDKASSEAQLGGVSEILEAYPSVALKLSGYADTTGSARANKKLSAQRAQAVKKELVRLGVASSRLDATSSVAHPSCAASDSEECKSKNRRVAAHVTAK